jgi:hypothetical protein
VLLFELVLVLVLGLLVAELEVDPVLEVEPVLELVLGLLVVELELVPILEVDELPLLKLPDL